MSSSSQATAAASCSRTASWGRDGLGYAKDKCTPHGFRSSFRDWAVEETNFPSEVVEMALAQFDP